MIKKTFNLGEWCSGGVISVEIQDKQITIINRDWDVSKGWSKNSDQSNAKEVFRQSVMSYEDNARYDLDLILNDITSSYYSEEIIKWIESKIKLETEYPWRQ